ncbi:hypothetical protein HKX48_002295, partial [Thoreauomyces humboldtii]
IKAYVATIKRPPQGPDLTYPAPSSHTDHHQHHHPRHRYRQSHTDRDDEDVHDDDDEEGGGNHELDRLEEEHRRGLKEVDGIRKALRM